MAAVLLNSLRIGLASARANLVPMLLLQVAAVMTVSGYYLVPSFRALWEPFAAWHRSYGCLAAFCCQAFFCGLLPGLFLLAFRSIRPRRVALTVLAQVLWCGTFGIGVHAVFRLLAAWFGDDASLTTLLLKTAFDQFVWTVLVIAPANAVFFFWLARDFSWTRMRREWPSNFISSVYLPNLISNWCVWIPVIFIVFAFPLELQIFVCGMACTFWSLMCLQLGRRSG